MRKARFTEHQIIAVIKSVEAGRTVKDVCREAGISEATYYLEVVNKTGHRVRVFPVSIFRFVWGNPPLYSCGLSAL